MSNAVYGTIAVQTSDVSFATVSMSLDLTAWGVVITLVEMVI